MRTRGAYSQHQIRHRTYLGGLSSSLSRKKKDPQHFGKRETRANAMAQLERNGYKYPSHGLTKKETDGVRVDTRPLPMGIG